MSKLLSNARGPMHLQRQEIDKECLDSQPQDILLLKEQSELMIDSDLKAILWKDDVSMN